MASSEAASADFESVGPSYTSPDITSCPPLVKLQAYGICCPFFETEEDCEARIGAQLLTNYPITWYRKQQQIENEFDDKDGSADNNDSGCLIATLVTGVDKLLGNDVTSMYIGIPATLSIIDTDQCGPLIKVKANETGGDQDCWDESTVSIPLHLVDSVSPGWSLTGDNTAGGIKLFARKQQSKGLLGLSSGAGEELLRFDTLGGGGDDWSETVLPVKSSEPNEHVDRIISRLRALIEWNRNRIADEVRQGKIIPPSGFVEISE